MLFKAKITYSEPKHFTTFDIAAVCHCLGGDPVSLDYRFDTNKKLEFGSFNVSLSKDDYEKIEGDCTKFKHLDAKARILYKENTSIDFLCVVARPMYSMMWMAEADYAKGQVRSIRSKIVKPDTLYVAFFQIKKDYMFTCQFGINPEGHEQEVCTFGYMRKSRLVEEEVRQFVFDNGISLN